ncbi:pentapeptide repeat-containing protein [Streptomyces sp. NBC_01803]|uniref:pentapeptide repeat-containing protein n=1 Tax=Streptomyces sp. NBC_01803 TaxID=2975946 RepID=UPI003FA34355
MGGTELPDADLSGADLRGADLNGAAVTVEQIVSAVIDSSTRLPANLSDDPAVRARITEVEAE